MVRHPPVTLFPRRLRSGAPRCSPVSSTAHSNVCTWSGQPDPLRRSTVKWHFYLQNLVPIGACPNPHGSHYLFCRGGCYRSLVHHKLGTRQPHATARPHARRTGTRQPHATARPHARRRPEPFVPSSGGREEHNGHPPVPNGSAGAGGKLGVGDSMCSRRNAVNT